MKLSEYRETYYEFSAKASDIARHLAFAGIAVIWIFRIEEYRKTTIPDSLIFPLIFFITALALDLVQYIAGTSVWGIFHWYHEKKLDNVLDDPKLDHPIWLKWPIFCPFVLKLISVIVGYILLLKYTWIIIC
ncbi:MAG: hypothetical protein JSU85_00975 [Candidatus Zixiibacteriota bacterium]|nr:MAG: hypothetical protein JSU85_00975 [candidate division Zixibacteria bacterium]